MKEINSAEQFHEARLFVKDYGLQRLKHEMGVPPHRTIGTSPLVGTQAREPSHSPPHTLPVAPGFVDKNTYQLTTTKNPFNVFAMAGAGQMGPGNEEDNAALERAGDAVSKDYAKRFRVRRNLPVNDENWNEGGKWVGVASMSARHRSDECVSNIQGPNVSWSGRSQPERNTRASAGS